MTRLNKHSFAHKKVADVQLAMAQEVFEHWAKNDAWYAANKDNRSQIVTEVAKTLRKDARRVLGEMCGRPDIPEDEKQRILDALIDDAALPDEDAWKVPAGLPMDLKIH